MSALNPIVHPGVASLLRGTEEGDARRQPPEPLTPSYPQAPRRAWTAERRGRIFAAMSALNRRERSVASPPFVSRSVRGNRQPLRGVQGTGHVARRLGTPGAGNPSGEWSATLLRRPLAKVGGSFA